jgi:hypothetical protein
MDKLLHLGFYGGLVETLVGGGQDPYSIILYAVKGMCNCNNDLCAVHDGYFYVEMLDFYIDILKRYLGESFTWTGISRVLLDNYFDILTERGGSYVFLDHCHALVSMCETVPQSVMLHGLIFVLSRANVNIDIVRYLETRINEFNLQNFEDYFVGDMSVDGFRQMKRILGRYMTDYNWISVIMLMILRGYVDNLLDIIDESDDILEYLNVDNLCDFIHHSEIAPRSDVLNILSTLKPELQLGDPDVFITMRRVIQDNEPTHTGMTVRRPMHRHSGMDHLVVNYPQVYRAVVYNDNPPFWSEEWFREVAYLTADEDPEILPAETDISSYIEDKDGECNICYATKRPIAVLCRDGSRDKSYVGHMFCVSCISTWLEDSSACPLCRSPIK